MNWHMTSVSAEGTDLISLNVVIENGAGEVRDLSETLDPPVDASTLEVEDYGGKNSSQQSILVTVSDGDETHQVQVEIDPSTGEFKESSLHDWEECTDI
jgi:hypothetical protein